MLWSVPHVRHWLTWAVRTFNLAGIKLSNWNLSGPELCALTSAEFQARVPSDPGGTFWTHLELLRKCKLVGKKSKFHILSKESSKNIFIYFIIECSVK